MPNLTQQVFNHTASTYDQDRSKLVPGFDSVYARTLELIPEKAKTIIDLGAGSGLLSVMLRERFPAAHLHLVDFSPAMLELAKQRLGNSPNITYHQADYTTADLPEACSIVSTFSIHHLDDPEKQLIYRRCYEALKPRGVFVNADHIAGPTPAMEEIYHQRWLAECRALGATEQQISDSLYRQKEDRRTPIEPQLRWLRDAGFENADVWFKESSFAVMTGTK